MRQKIVAATVTLLVAALGAGSAFAGEVTGTGKSLEPLHANSICAYSGLNDRVAGEGPVDERVQSFGWVVKDIIHAGGSPIGGVPGTECRGGSL
jgi:hypothetical protein